MNKLWKEYGSKFIFFTVCYFFYTPLLNFLSNVVPKLPEAFSQKYYNEMVKGAAKMQLRYTYYDTFTIIFFIGLAYLLWMAYDNVKKQINNPALANHKEDNIQARWALRVLIVCFIGICLNDAYHGSNLALQRELIMDFQQNMNVIKPYINDGQRDLMFSRWALMKEERDYVSICEFINRVAKENSIQLPVEMYRTNNYEDHKRIIDDAHKMFEEAAKKTIQQQNEEILNPKQSK